MREHGETETFSNPLPPEAHAHHHQHDDDEHPLTNDDFRKLLMTPGGPQVSSSRSSSSKASSATEPHHSRTSSSSSRDHAGGEHGKEDVKEGEEDDAATRRRKKKSYYAKLKKLEDERQKELDQKYRDRARERRDGQNTDTGQTGDVSTTADYRAVAPDIKMGESYAERRKQIIQESKYLGGDMEHTHLVKGLDFALLEKVRAEITNKEIQDDQLEQYLNQNQVQQQQKKQEKEEDPEMQIEFKSKLARNIYRVACKPRPHERNELFLPRRMAYVVDLEDEYADSDIPTTLIRSKADCATSESTTIMSTNDIVINKLTQILAYLRQGKRDRKKLKKDKGKREEEKNRAKLPGGDESIYPEGHDIYPMLPPQKESRVKREPKEERPSTSSRSREERDGRRESGRDRERERSDRDRERERRDRDRDRGRGERDERKRKSYFEKPADEDEEMKEPQRPQNARDLVKTINDKFAGHPGWEEQRRDERKPVKREEERMKKIKKRMEIDSYAECYPGMEESADAVIDSDEEADYTKMDMGNKKGPVGRWDFENQDDYSNYMSTKEALPKAAFQYGVKMADGRKTRRAGPKDEKAQLDRQWQKIQNIIQKRKGEPEGKSGGKQARYH